MTLTKTRICGEGWGDDCARFAYDEHECARVNRHRGSHECECGARRRNIKRKKLTAAQKRRALKRKADDIAGARCRARGYCEMKVLRPELKCKPPLQWCHIVSRTYHSTRWDEDNCFCGCAAHHTYFGTHPDDWHAVLEKHWPGRHQELWDRAQVQWDGDLGAVISALSVDLSGRSAVTE